MSVKRQRTDKKAKDCEPYFVADINLIWNEIFTFATEAPAAQSIRVNSLLAANRPHKRRQNKLRTKREERQTKIYKTKWKTKIDGQRLSSPKLCRCTRLTFAAYIKSSGVHKVLWDTSQKSNHNCKCNENGRRTYIGRWCVILAHRICHLRSSPCLPTCSKIVSHCIDLHPIHCAFVHRGINANYGLVVTMRWSVVTWLLHARTRAYVMN